MVPAGQYERVPSEAIGRDVPVAGSYTLTEANPQGFFDIAMAPITGFVSANDVALFVLMIGAFIGVVTATGAIDAGIKRAMTRLKGREKWMIPILSNKAMCHGNSLLSFFSSLMVTLYGHSEGSRISL